MVMRKTKVTCVNGKEVSTDLEGGFFLSHVPEGEFVEGDELEISGDPQNSGMEIVRNLRTGKEIRLPLPEPGV